MSYKPHSQNTKAATTGLDFYYQPDAEQSYQVLQTLEKVYGHLVGKVFLNPVVVTKSAYSQYNIENDCLFEGKYCVNNPKQKGLKGRLVAIESIRQKCIFGMSPELFFRYMKKFQGKCLDSFKEECSKSVAAELGVSWDRLRECYDSSFTNGLDSDNRLLRTDFVKTKTVSNKMYPLIVINDYVYEGSIEVNDILLSLCSTLNPETSQCKNIRFDVEESVTSFELLLIDMSIVVLGLILVVILCRRVAKKRYQR